MAVMAANSAGANSGECGPLIRKASTESPFTKKVPVERNKATSGLDNLSAIKLGTGRLPPWYSWGILDEDS
jgi:hypothetical protein